MPDVTDTCNQIAQHLHAQVWLLGAGISYSANIPLMDKLSNRIRQYTNHAPKHTETAKLLSSVRNELPENSHIEDWLSHISDYIAISTRTNGNIIQINGQNYSKTELEHRHSDILYLISHVIRLGDDSSDAINPDVAPETPLENRSNVVDISLHCRFARALSRQQTRAGGRDQTKRLFTTNYDTLLEDALALECVEYIDQFSGGAVAYWNPNSVQEPLPSDRKVRLFKLHGSIDWYFDPSYRVWRCRDADTYPADRRSRVMIYPQATKYLLTQVDPFAHQFSRLRESLVAPGGTSLVICGYSFGDEHINSEIERALKAFGSQLTLVVCSKLIDPRGRLHRWRQQPQLRKRIFVLSQDGIYADADEPIMPPDDGKKHDWWTFEGLCTLMENGGPHPGE